MSRIIINHLKILDILIGVVGGRLLGLLTDLKIDAIFAKRPRPTTGGIMQKEPLNLHRTIKRGIMLYCVLAVVAVPSGICSHQHRTPDFEMPVLTRILPEYQMPIALDPASQLTHLESNAAASATPSPEVYDREQFDETSADTLPFNEHIMAAAQKYDIDAALIRAIIWVESSDNPQAVSRRGAKGLMQLMPSTARSLGIEDCFDPAMNIDGGVRYFRYLLDRFEGDEALALAAYNAGSRYVRKYQGVPPFRTTRIYIKKVMKYREQFEKETAFLNDFVSAS